MKIIFAALLFTSFTVKASPVMSMKERLRIHLWVNGLEDKPVKKKVQTQNNLPEELERSLRKI